MVLILGRDPSSLQVFWKSVQQPLCNPLSPRSWHKSLHTGRIYFKLNLKLNCTGSIYMYFCMVAYSKRCCIISFTIWSCEMKGAGTVGSIHLIQSILVLTLQRVYLSPDLSHVLFELTFIHYCKKKQQNIQASHPIFKCFKHILICGVQLPSPSPSEGRWNEQMKERQRDTWKRVNNYMPPINLMKLWKKWGRFLLFFFLLFFVRLH